MAGLAVTLNTKLKTEVKKDVGESSAKEFGLFVIPGKHVGIVDVREEQRASWLGCGRGATVEHEKTFRVVSRDSQQPKREQHASHENAVYDMQGPAPSHGNRAEAGEHCCVLAHVDETHASVISL